MYNLLLLAQKPIGMDCYSYIRQLSSSKMLLSGVVTNKSTNNWWRNNDIYLDCMAHGLTIIDNSRSNNDEIIQFINRHKVNLIVSIQHSWILSEQILKAVNFQAYNLHLAKLPEYKGYNTFTHALLNREKEYSVTMHKMAAAVDAGDIILQKSFPIKQKDTAKSVYSKSVALGFEVFREFISMLLSGKELMFRSHTGKACFYKRDSLDGMRCILDPTNYDEVDVKSRAFCFPPFESAYLLINGKKIHLIPDDLESREE